MKPRSRQRIALLLTVVLALLPMQGLLAALASGPASGHAGHAAMASVEHGDHGIRHEASALPECPMHQPGQSGMTSDHCNGGCDMCGACSAAMLPLPALALLPAHDPRIPDARIAHSSAPAYTPFRPPRH